MALRDVPEDESRAALENPSFCRDATPWVQDRKQPIYRCAAGLVDAEGNPLGRVAELLVNESVDTGIRRFKFSVFKISAGFQERIYQLDVTRWPRMPADLHARPHERFGQFRGVPQSDWARWTYHEAFEHFVRTTLIDFDPLPEDPFANRLL